MSAPMDPLRAWPKVDLHCHLEGAIRPATLFDLYQRNHGAAPGGSLEALRPHIQVTGAETSLFDFLAKFERIMPALKTEADLVQITREAAEDAARDGVVYLELRFSPHFIAEYSGLSPRAATRAVVEGRRQAEATYDLLIELIAIIPQYGGRQVAAETVALAREHCAGMDIAGDIRQIGLDAYAPELARAAEAGLGITIHAGEITPAETLVTAVEHLHARRIGHGIRAVDDPQVLAMLIERQILLEVCLSSNLQTRAAASIQTHPFHALRRAGVWVCLNTDDPAISKVTLSDEYRLAQEHLGLGRADLLHMDRRAMAAAFTRADRREQVQRRLAQALSADQGGAR